MLIRKGVRTGQDAWTALLADPSPALSPALPLLARAAEIGNAGGQLLAVRLQGCLDSMAALADRLLTYAELNESTAEELRSEPHCHHLVYPYRNREYHLVHRSLRFNPTFLSPNLTHIQHSFPTALAFDWDSTSPTPVACSVTLAQVQIHKCSRLYLVRCLSVFATKPRIHSPDSGAPSVASCPRDRTPLVSLGCTHAARRDSLLLKLLESLIRLNSCPIPLQYLNEMCRSVMTTLVDVSLDMWAVGVQRCRSAANDLCTEGAIEGIR